MLSAFQKPFQIWNNIYQNEPIKSVTLGRGDSKRNSVNNQWNFKARIWIIYNICQNKKNKKDAIRLYHDINLYIIEKKNFTDLLDENISPTLK